MRSAACSGSERTLKESLAFIREAMIENEQRNLNLILAPWLELLGVKPAQGAE